MTATEHPESVALRHPGATQSPDGSQGAPEGPRGAEGATGHGISAVPHLETAPLPSASDVRPVPPARDAELVEFEAVSAARYEAGLSAEGRAARHAALAWGAEFRTAWIEAMQERAQQHVDPDGLSAERDRARSLAARLEAENARLREGIESMMRDVGKAQPAHVTPGIVAVRLKALLAEDEGGE